MSIRGLSPITTTYQYDNADRLTAKTLPNTANQSGTGGISVAYDYDNASRLTGITYRRADLGINGGVIEQITYTYDAAGQRISKSTLNDVGNQETPFTATHNPANRMTAITLNPNNQAGFVPPTATTYNLSYDDSGNLTSKTNPSSPTDTATYTWDSRNRLTSISGNGYR